jgi:AraC-like DNA-binding protein/mannose-6-phosphate isomerase-like protein (cupin superfamily)
MQEISPEEKRYLDGSTSVNRELYTGAGSFEIDRKRFLKEGRLITVRPHSRFIEFPLHRHNYIEIMYVCKGTITHCLDGQELVMKKGDMLLLNQHVQHAVKRADYDDIGINFIAPPEFFDIPLQMLKENNVLADFLVNTLRQKNPVSHYLLFRLEENPAIENLMENMIASMLDDVQNEDSINQYSMGIVFLYLLRHMECLTEGSSQDYREIVVQSTLAYIDTWYKTASLSKLAEDFHQSLSVLSKLIRQSTGFTFQELLQRKRFQKAVMLLLDTDLSVEEIAEAVGYENLSYFYRQFKERYGMTPRKYRLEHREDEQVRL